MRSTARIVAALSAFALVSSAADFAHAGAGDAKASAGQSESGTEEPAFLIEPLFGASALSADEAVQSDATDAVAASATGVQQTDFVLEPMPEVAPPVAQPYSATSKYFGLWHPTEAFGVDARCAPTPFAPRGYGFPKKVAPFRMDYTPYRVRDCGLGSIHGPSLWWRHHRDPCCGFSCSGNSCCICGKCKRAVDNQ